MYCIVSDSNKGSIIKTVSNYMHLYMDSCYGIISTAAAIPLCRTEVEGLNSDFYATPFHKSSSFSSMSHPCVRGYLRGCTGLLTKPKTGRDHFSDTNRKKTMKNPETDNTKICRLCDCLWSAHARCSRLVLHKNTISSTLSVT